jgi:hypothetical protein
MKPTNPYTADYRILPATGVRSLIWSGSELIDWVGGAMEYGLDGTKRGPFIAYPYRFDAAVASPSGRYVALYERLGTKAVILGADRFLLREVNRSYYHAHVFEYPIVFFSLFDGREALAHCPEEYCDLRLEEPATGARWSTPGSGCLQSMFHSRLAANGAGDRILSAGWVWHPFDTVRVFDLKPSHDSLLSLEACDGCSDRGAEVSSAAFLQSGRLVVTCAKDAEDFLSDEPGDRVRPGMIGVYDLDEQTLVTLAPLEDEAGTLMPLGDDYVVGFFDHPKLIEVSTGRVLFRWAELKTGQQNSSILWHKPLPPPLTLDPSEGRFAVADGGQITVVTLAPHLRDR